MMRRLVQFAVVLAASTVAASVSARMLPQAAEPALTVYTTCLEANLSPLAAINQLEEMGWQNVTAENRFRQATRDAFNTRTRAFLSLLTYPDPFDALESASPDDIAAKIERDVQKESFESFGQLDGEESAGRVFLMEQENGQAIAVINFFRGQNYTSLDCKSLTHAAVNPVLVQLLLSLRHDAMQRGAVLERFRTTKNEVNTAHFLSEHARRIDHRFDTPYTVVLRSMFVERHGRQ